MNQNIPIATAVTDIVEGANGSLSINNKVKTQYTREEGGDGKWYKGRITEIHPGNICTVIYDDGDKWFGNAKYVYLDEPIPSTIPIVPLVANPVAQTISPSAPPMLVENQPEVVVVNDNNLYAQCRDCNATFLRDPLKKGSSSYYRCPDCQKNQVGRCIVNSCLIS